MNTSYRLVAMLVSLAAAGSAVASDRLSEAAYLKAARCQGLAHAASLGAVDTSGIDAMMREQGKGRDPRVRNQATELRNEARRGAESATNKARLLNERDTRCAAWLAPRTVADAGVAAAR
jgi:hypothetical protein